MSLKTITPFLSYWRRTVALDREVVDAVVADDHARPSEALQSALDEWPGVYYWSRPEGPSRLVLIRTLAPAKAERWWLHILLFVITFFSVWAAGAVLTGTRLLPSLSRAGPAAWATDFLRFLVESPQGLAFAVALLAILLLHELGHYVVARRYQINASPPYFLPAPFPSWLGLIGTFGAFIRLRSPVIDRRQLLDVGAAGPWAGLVVSLVVLVWGLVLSQPLPNVPGPTEQLIYVVGFGGDRFPLFLGDSLLMSAAKTLLVGEGTILLHPLAAAGWFGLLVTMMNLMPLGQLDGGHVVYSLLGRHQSKVGFLMWIALVVMGFQFKIWWVWAALILVLGRGRISHPSVLDPYRPVPRSRWILGLATAVLFVLTFSVDPIPFG